MALALPAAKTSRPRFRTGQCISDAGNRGAQVMGDPLRVSTSTLSHAQTRRRLPRLGPGCGLASSELRITAPYEPMNQDPLDSYKVAGLYIRQRRQYSWGTKGFSKVKRAKSAGIAPLVCDQRDEPRFTWSVLGSERNILVHSSGAHPSKDPSST